jgi:hypothetical protein
MFVALDIQHATGMRRIVLSSVACLALQNVFHIISKTARLKKLFNIQGVFRILSDIFLSSKEVSEIS